MNVVVDEKRRGRVMGLYAAMVALGMALGPRGAAGGRRLWADAVPHRRGAVAAGGAAAAAALAHRAAHPGRSAKAASPRSWSPAPLAMFAAFACGLGEQVAFSFLPVYAVGAGVAPDTGALWLSAFVMGNVVLQWPIGWAADHADRRLVLAGCTLASAAAGARPVADPGAMDRHRDRRGAVGRHVVLDLSGRAGAARPALPRRRHRPRQHRLQPDLRGRRAGRPADRPARRWTCSAIPASAGRSPSSIGAATLAALLAMRRPG